MKKSMLLVALLTIALSAVAKDDGKVVYVGEGRYSCSGNSAACAQVDSNNRQVSDRSANDYQRSQDAAQRYVDEQRRRDEDRRYGK